MAMQGINLVPGRRLELRRRRSLRRRCFMICISYAAAATGAVVLALAFVNQNSTGMAELVMQASTEVDHSTADIALVRAELEQANSVLGASRAIAEQPDWSHLLALLAKKAGKDVTLRGCSVRPREAPAVVAKTPVRGQPAKPAAAPDPTVLVNVLGIGSSQAAVSQFAIRLEATRLFDRVTLLDTSREPFIGVQLVSFRIECTLAEPGKANTAKRQLAGGLP